MKHVAGLVLSLGVALAPSVLHAQDAWPARPITFLVPYGAGGYTDLVARLAVIFSGVVHPVGAGRVSSYLLLLSGRILQSVLGRSSSLHRR